MQPRFLRRLFGLLALVSFARAAYYIDDQNFTSLVYSENPGGAKWGPFQEGGETLSITLANGTMMTIDASQCYNYTYTYAACTVADNCQVQIPFTGSGITIYVLQAGAQGINASVTIDGGKPQYNVLPGPPGPNFYIPNVTLFNIQGITTGNHVATMTVQNWDNIFSGMMFDYALINETVVTFTTTTSSSSTSSTAASTTSNPATTTASTSSKSGPNTGAIVGGVVGGLAAIAATVIGILYCWRRQRAKRLSLNLDAEPKLHPFYAPQTSAFNARGLYSDTPEQTAESIMTPRRGLRSTEPSSSSASLRPSKSQMAITNPSASQTRTASVSSPSHTASRSADSAEISSPSRIQQIHPMLTDDQADFVTSLYANNVPAVAVARVIERMMAGERRPAVEGYDSLPPPSYDLVTGRS